MLNIKKLPYEICKPEEVAEYLGVHHQTVRRWVHQGELAPLRPDMMVFARSTVIQFGNQPLPKVGRPRGSKHKTEV